MAVTGAETSSTSGTKPESSTGTQRKRGGNRKNVSGPTTTLDDDVTRPSTMAPGDTPYDTTDPLERATSVEPDKAAAARAGFGTVNAAIPLPEPEVEDSDDGREHRIERYKVRGPDGKLVDVTHDLETGETKVG